MGQTDARTSILTPLGLRVCHKLVRLNIRTSVRFTHKHLGGGVKGDVGGELATRPALDCVINKL